LSTRRIWAKYTSGHPDPATLIPGLDGRDRIHILIRPHQLIAVASI
jgi:hypothetical protein